jgi:hypothetical protein
MAIIIRAWINHHIYVFQEVPVGKSKKNVAK